MTPYMYSSILVDFFNLFAMTPYMYSSILVDFFNLPNDIYLMSLSQSDGINVHAAKEILQLSLRGSVGSAAIS